MIVNSLTWIHKKLGVLENRLLGFFCYIVFIGLTSQLGYIDIIPESLKEKLHNNSPLSQTSSCSQSPADPWLWSLQYFSVDPSTCVLAGTVNKRDFDIIFPYRSSVVLWLASLTSNHRLSPVSGFDSHKWQ